jgi:PAS domain S-box-containing protein
VAPNPPAAIRESDDTDLWCLPFAAEPVPDDTVVLPSPLATFRAVVEHDTDAVCILDADLAMVYANAVARAMFALPDRLKSWTLPDGIERVHADDLPQIEVPLATRGRVCVDARILMPDGAWRWFSITVQDMRDNPEVNGLVVKLRDIDEAKRNELASQEKIAALERQNENKSVYLSTISHEMRTPLTAIIGYSEYLTINADNPQMVAEDAEVIHREATRLSRLVDDVLLMDRVDNNHISLNLKPLDVNELVEAVAEALRPLLARNRLMLQLDPTLPRIQADRDRLDQALTNLISNAVKFSEPGGAITVTTARDDAEVVISVSDEGIGIAPEDQERIFNRFERVQTGAAGRTVGTGIGLAIVKEIARLHHGRVWVTSELRVGSTFSLSLPISVS